MSEPKYPLCLKAGLKLERIIVDGEPRNYNDYWMSVRADDVEAYLRAVEIANLGRETVAIMKDHYSGERTVPISPQPAPPWDFRAEDFDPGGPPADDGQYLCTYAWAARAANAKLAEWLAASPVVECSDAYPLYGEVGWVAESPTISTEPRRTHTARLVAITPIAKPDSIERLVRELADEMPESEFARRARKLLEVKP